MVRWIDATSVSGAGGVTGGGGSGGFGAGAGGGRAAGAVDPACSHAMTRRRSAVRVTSKDDTHDHKRLRCVTHDPRNANIGSIAAHSVVVGAVAGSIKNAAVGSPRHNTDSPFRWPSPAYVMTYEPFASACWTAAAFAYGVAGSLRVAVINSGGAVVAPIACSAGTVFGQPTANARRLALRSARCGAAATPDSAHAR